MGANAPSIIALSALIGSSDSPRPDLCLAVVDAGQLVCEIGVAPVKPAEFVIFRLAQFSGGAALSE